MNDASSALSMKLMGTSTTPSRASANRSAAERVRVAGEDGDAIARRNADPGQTGSKAIADASNSAKVQVVAPQTIAVFRGSRARCAAGCLPGSAATGSWLASGRECHGLGGQTTGLVGPGGDRGGTGGRAQPAPR